MMHVSEDCVYKGNGLQTELETEVLEVHMCSRVVMKLIDNLYKTEEDVFCPARRRVNSESNL